MLSASAEIVAHDLRSYGEDDTAEWLLACTEEELVRVCSVAEWLLYEGPKPESGASMLFARALSLAAVYVHEGSPRELARRRRRALSGRPADAGRRPDDALAASLPYAYGVGDDARALWGPGA